MFDILGFFYLNFKLFLVSRQEAISPLENIFLFR